MNSRDLADAPPMEVSDIEAWNWYKTAYVGSIMGLAERWARLMQLGLTQGKALREVWVDALRSADIHELPTATIAEAAKVLVRCWRYGPQLRPLYTRRYGALPR